MKYKNLEIELFELVIGGIVGYALGCATMLVISMF